MARSLLNEARGVLVEGLDLAQDWLALAELETRQTGVGFVQMIGKALLLVLLVLCSWLCLVAAGIVLLIAAGAPASAALLGAAVANGLGAGWVWRSYRHDARQLGWRGSLRALRFRTAPADPATHA